jgi:hypothetical protein
MNISTYGSLNSYNAISIALSFLFISGSVMTAQSGAVIPQGGAGHANQASCVILKRMGPADQVTSHLYSFGIRGKQFQYVEGKLPEGFPFHGRLTDHDVRNLQGRGSEVLMLEPHYTAEDLKQAREQCKGMTGANPNQVPIARSGSEQGTEKSATSPAQPSAEGQSTPGNPSQNSPGSQASLIIDSTPPGADIELDGAFVGNTPSTIVVAPGSHEISVKKRGFTPWTRKMSITGGSVHLNAELEVGSSASQ